MLAKSHMRAALFNRNPRYTARGDGKRMAMAHRILDRVMLGEAVRDVIVDWALHMTGDLPLRDSGDNSAADTPTNDPNDLLRGPSHATRPS